MFDFADDAKREAGTIDKCRIVVVPISHSISFTPVLDLWKGVWSARLNFKNSLKTLIESASVTSFASRYWND